MYQQIKNRRLVMGRRKSPNRKEKKILIRVNDEEKQLADNAARKAGKNTSEFIRSLIREREESKKLEVHVNIAEKYEKMLDKYENLLKEFKRIKDR